MTNSDIISSPQVQELKQRCELLRDELAALHAEREHLVNTVGPNILAIYATKIGVKEYEALCLDVEVRRLKATIEKIQAVENQGKKPNLEQIEAAVEDELQAWKAKVDKMLGEITASQDRLKSQLSAEESAELLKLYRSLAKKLHPDLNPGLTEKHKMLWADDMEMPNQLDYLQKRLDQLRFQAEALMQQIARIKSEVPYTLAEKLDDPEWIKVQTAECDSRIKKFAEAKAGLDAWLSLWKGQK
jgi:FtsZ-binding cell division protein ZapB